MKQRLVNTIKYLGLVTSAIILLTGYSLAFSPTDPNYIWGVTVDNISGLSDIVTSLASLPTKPTTRIVFDEWVNPPYYTTAVTNIGQKSYIMGELLDSFYVKQYTLDQYTARVNSYLDAFSGKVDIWEIGNEVNGEWLGTTPDVVAKITSAYSIVKSRGQKTALTLYYNGAYDNGIATNNNCWSRPQNHMMTWARANIPQEMKEGLDYVLVSYYEEDCLNIRPDWQAVFDEVGSVFPNAKIGFGEIGRTGTTDQKAAYLTRYYSMNINHPRFIGGFFWWYYKQDMVPYTKPLWTTLYNVIKSETATQIFPTPTPSPSSIPTITPTPTPTITPSPSSTPTPSRAGDANGDSKVNESDYLIWKSNYNTAGYGASRGDFNLDNIVDGADYVIWLINYTG